MTIQSPLGSGFNPNRDAVGQFARGKQAEAIGVPELDGAHSAVDTLPNDPRELADFLDRQRNADNWKLDGLWVAACSTGDHTQYEAGESNFTKAELARYWELARAVPAEASGADSHADTRPEQPSPERPGAHRPIEATPTDPHKLIVVLDRQSDSESAKLDDLWNTACGKGEFAEYERAKTVFTAAELARYRELDCAIRASPTATPAATPAESPRDPAPHARPLRPTLDQSELGTAGLDNEIAANLRQMKDLADRVQVLSTRSLARRVLTADRNAVAIHIRSSKTNPGHMEFFAVTGRDGRTSNGADRGWSSDAILDVRLLTAQLASDSYAWNQYCSQTPASPRRSGTFRMDLWAAARAGD